MMRPCLLALGMALFIGPNGLAQEIDTVPADATIGEVPAELTIASLGSVPEEPAPSVSAEPTAENVSGIGYYSTPHSDETQMFQIVNLTDALFSQDALQSRADYDRGHAADR